jgi:hypothetical protein
MGSIIGSKVVNEGKVVFSIVMDHEEALHLKGHIDKIHMFSERNLDVKTNVSMRGSMSATKYFLIPKGMRHNIRFNSEVLCQKIETKDKLLFVYIIDKYQL